MQDKIETQKIKLARLNQRLAEMDAERDRFQKEAQALKSSLPEDTSTGFWSHAAGATVGLLVVSCLLVSVVIDNAQSNLKKNDQPVVSAISELENVQIVRNEFGPASGKKKPLSRSGKKKTRFARVNAASQRQWGPLLVMPESAATKRYLSYDPLVKQQQKNLLTLGFDLGKADGFKGLLTRQAIAEFRALYLPDNARQLQDDDLAVIMEVYANLARSDAARYGIDEGIVAAIRLSSVRTGVDFPYLMKLAATESNFRPESEAETSSAAGLYQFTHDTWLKVLKTYGVKYGLVADYATNIEYKVTRSGYQRPFVRDKSIYQHLLALRKNPRLSAMMAAETVHDNQQKLAHSFDREPTETDLYLTHFLGADGAITFLQSLEQSPGKLAVDLFPEAASSNRDIFHPEDTTKPRTVDDVYALFEEKFRSRRYDDFATN